MRIDGFIKYLSLDWIEVDISEENMIRVNMLGDMAVSRIDCDWNHYHSHCIKYSLADLSYH